MRKFLTVVVFGVACASAHAEMYKCNKGGRVEYSDVPCQNALRKEGDQWVDVATEQRKKREDDRKAQEQKERQIRLEKDREEHDRAQIAIQRPETSAGIPFSTD